MRLAASGIFVLLLLLAPCAGATQEVIFITRHAEQVEGGEDPPLAEAGRRRAQALADLLRGSGISVIYTSELQRTRLTAEPLARMLQIPIQVHPGRDTETLIRRVRERHAQDRILIVGHSNTVPELLRALGHAEEIRIDRNEYDNLFVLLPRPEGPPIMVRQRLTPCPTDSSEPGTE